MTTTIQLYATGSKISLSQRLNTARSGCIALLCSGLMVLAGCGSGSGAKPTVEGISITDVTGTPLSHQLTTLSVSQGVYVDATLSGDTKMLGAEWSVVCGSAPLPGTPLPPGQTQDESCGTFTPAHTLSGPVPSYVTNALTSGYVALYVAPAETPKQGVVTLYASSTADPSRNATLTLTMGGKPISVNFAPAPPSTLQVGASTQLKALLTNDVSNAGVQWSVVCGSVDCGFFGPVDTTSGVATTYVAPSPAVPGNGYVLVTATSLADPTKAVSASISITP